MEPPRPPLLKRLAPGHWVAVDCATVTLVVLLTTLLTRGGLPGPSWAQAVAVLVSLAAGGFRRRLPPRLLVAAVLGTALLAVVSSAPAAMLATAYVIYLVPLRLSRREALEVLGAVAGVAVFGGFYQARVPNPGGYGPGGYGPGGLSENGVLALLLLAVVLGWLCGYLVAQQRAYAAVLEAQAEQRASAELAEARRARSDERLAIARELHDVLAHSMSLIAVQAGVANHVAEERPDEVRRALGSIEETSRGALHELRALLGVLRGADGAAPAPGSPVPALSDLEELVARTAEAGVSVQLDEAGQRPSLPPGLELAIYRVVQESVTNVIKHAATDRCRVALDYGPDSVTVEITDSGASRRAAVPGGHGIAGMRERVGMYGGELRAGPLPGRGFRVEARFPLASLEVSP